MSIDTTVMSRSLLALALTLTLGTPALSARTTVILDPGHGGSDNGAFWHGQREKVLNLDVALRVERILKSRGVPTVLTRRSDVYVTTNQRAAIANRYRSALFVSIHFNASSNRSARGIETFYYSARGRTIAANIQRSLMSRMRQSTDRGIKYKGYSVLVKTRCPAVLVECGFLSNSWENRRCADPAIRQIIAEQIAQGILRSL
jgi:N-acetylmuramoyl-L-alanine amidase